VKDDIPGSTSRTISSASFQNGINDGRPVFISLVRSRREVKREILDRRGKDVRKRRERKKKEDKTYR